MEIVLGCLAKDTVTGFTGIVSSRTEWLNGCIRIGLQPRELKDGKPIESQAFDIEQLEYVGPGMNPEPGIAGRVRRVFARTGGDRPDADRPRAIEERR